MKENSTIFGNAYKTMRTEGRAAPVRRSDYWISVVMLLFVAEFFIGIIALCYGIITTPPSGAGGVVRIQFPWMGWLAAAVMAPAVILGFAQVVARKSGQGELREGLGSEDGREGSAAGDVPESEAAWAERLPERALKVYRFIKDAPLFMISAALVGLGATLLVIDGAFSLVQGLLVALMPYLPYFIGGATAFAIAVAALMAWFKHKNNQLAAEYAFRREVLEKTGVILISGNKALLPPENGGKYSVGVLPSGKDTEVALLEASPVEQGEDGTSADAADSATDIIDVPLASSEKHSE